MGSSHGEKEPKKATYFVARRNIKPPTPLGKNSQEKGETFPPQNFTVSGKSQGNPIVELATPKRT
jgi:hypothetical protein